MRRKNKQGQEEMVGFVLIIVLVAVIALVFLAITLRKPAVTSKSGEIAAFLESSLSYTTTCQPSPEQTYNLQELTGACYNGETCLDNTLACDILNETAVKLVEIAFPVARYKGYEYKIYLGNETNVLLQTAYGNKTGSLEGDEVSSYWNGETIYFRLRLFT